MADVTLTYKGSDILELSDSGSATLKTGGKYCEDDVTVEYVKPSGGGEDLLEKRILNAITSYSNATITSIPPYCFYGMTALESVSFPNVTDIGASAFQNTGLTGFVAEKYITTVITSSAFRGSAIRFAVFKGGSNRTDVSYFEQCSNLLAVDFATLSTYYGVQANAYYNTHNLQSLILREENRVVKLTGAFPSNSALATTANIYVPSALVNDYKAATNWSVYADRILPIEGSQYDGYWANGEAITT